MYYFWIGLIVIILIMIVEKPSCAAKSNLESLKCTLQNAKDKYMEIKKKTHIGTTILEDRSLILVKKPAENWKHSKNLMPIQHRPYTGNSTSIYQNCFFFSKPEVVATFNWNKRLDYNTHTSISIRETIVH